MPLLARITLCGLVGVLTIAQIGCNMVPQRNLQQSQLRTRQLYNQNKSLAVEKSQLDKMAADLAAQRQQIEQQNNSLRSDLNVANQRMENLNDERAKLQQRYVSLLKQSNDQTNPLTDQLTERMKRLAAQYPGFEFDPRTGVSKFQDDILFTSGSAQLRTDAQPILRDFASIMNDPGAQELNILVVGHTDDVPIGKKATKSKHATNWHLSTDRANSVLLTLAKNNIKDSRMGAAGYGKNQPLVPNVDEASRQRNRRVEIFVLAPDAIVAGWDPGTTERR